MSNEIPFFFTSCCIYIKKCVTKWINLFLNQMWYHQYFSYNFSHKIFQMNFMKSFKNQKPYLPISKFSQIYFLVVILLTTLHTLFHASFYFLNSFHTIFNKITHCKALLFLLINTFFFYFCANKCIYLGILFI